MLTVRVRKKKKTSPKNKLCFGHNPEKDRTVRPTRSDQLYTNY